MSNKLNFSQLTMQDALDLAILIEHEAQERYEDFSRIVGSGREYDASDFFKEMSKNEAKHKKELSDRREKLFKNAPPNVDASMVWDVEAPGFDEPRTYMSVKQALQLALRAEKKAYQFFDEALKFIKSPDVRKIFEELRDEEKEHQRMLEKQLARLPEGDSGPDIDDDGSDEPPAL